MRVWRFAARNRLTALQNNVCVTKTNPIPCVFNWIEDRYPQYYDQPTANLLTYNNNSYRYYTKTDTLLVYNPAYNHVYSGYSYLGIYYYIDLGGIRGLEDLDRLQLIYRAVGRNSGFIAYCAE